MRETGKGKKRQLSGEDQSAASVDDDVREKRELISQLSREFFTNGWMTGTGGALLIKTLDGYLVTASGVLKERQKPEEIFHLNPDFTIKTDPGNNLKISSCLPNFKHICRLRNAGAIYHVHNTNAVIGSLITDGNYFVCRHLQMIKGMFGHGWDDELRVPIIENKATEDAIADVLELAVRDNPQVNALIIRRHGMYVWGQTWKEAKIQAESLDWLLKVSNEMRLHGLDPAKPVDPAKPASN